MRLSVALPYALLVSFTAAAPILIGSTSNDIQERGGREISFKSLLADSIPCSLKAGTSENCKPGALANPPPKMRPCLAIEQCRS